MELINQANEDEQREHASGKSSEKTKENKPKVRTDFNTKGTPLHRKRRRLLLSQSLIGKARGISNALRPHWKLLVAVSGILGFALAVYALRPTFAASLLNPPSGSPPYYTLLSISNQGGISVNDVTATCMGEKAVFSSRYTFEMNGIVADTTFSAPEVRSGESFVVECTYPWFLYMNEERGFFSYGKMTGGKLATPLTPLPVIEFIRNGPTQIRSYGPWVIKPGWIEDMNQYSEYPMVAMDVNVVINYKTFGIKHSRIFRLIGEDFGAFLWKLQPTSEPPIADGIGGFKLYATGTLLILRGHSAHVPGTPRPATKQQ